MTFLPELIGESPGILAVRESVRRLFTHRSGPHRLPPVLIEGETGTGKGLLAHALHGASPRASGPFVSVNCAAIPDTLLEAEMFGFERGAFTDARQAKPGLFQAAHRGTIFLDEIALMPEALQGKLLKAIEDREVRRLGAVRSEPVDVWIVAATSEDLAAARRARRFHEALYHRLSVIGFRLPPLRERGDDIVALARHFLASVCADYGLPPMTFAPDVEPALRAHSWPGNVRELANAIERAALLSEGSTVTSACFGLTPSPTAPPTLERGPTLGETVEAVEREQILAALTDTGWNVSRAAARLGLPRNTLVYRIAKLGLRRTRRASPAAASRPAAPAASAYTRWEHRHVGFLKVAFSAAAAEALDSAAEKVRAFGGRVEEIAPGSLLGTFGLDPAEDAVSRAAHAGLAVQKAAGRQHETSGGPATRIGLHVARVQTARTADAVQVNLDDKTAVLSVLDGLIERGQPNAVLVSAEAARFLDRRFAIDADADASGRPRRLLRLAPTAFAPGRRVLSRFVGRAVEMDVLGQALEQTRRSAGRVVGVVGEPGVGKSRLLDEFRRTLADVPVTYLEARCVSHAAAIPYGPIVDLVRQVCRIGEADAQPAVADKIRDALEAAGLAGGRWAPCIGALLGLGDGDDGLALLSPEAVKARTFAALREMLLEHSGRRPIVLAVEDLHWIDRTSEEFLASLVEGAAGAGLLLVCTYRPGYAVPWLTRSYASQLTLGPLSPDDSRVIVDAILTRKPQATPLAEAILETAEGNPFFLEELALDAVDHAGGAPLVIPDTVQAVVLARMDRLGLETRRVLQTAAVLGREFSSRLLAAVAPSPVDLEPHLRELQRLEFVHGQPRADESVYAFKHALTHDVAYASLLPGDRTAIHAAAGRALEALYAGRLAEVYDSLAHHFARTDDHDTAVAYLVAAADKAAAGYAHADAVTALGEAMRHVERVAAGDRRQLCVDLVLRQAHSLYLIGRLAATRELLLRHLPDLEETGDPSRAGRYYFWLGHTSSSLSEYDRAREWAVLSLAEARRAGDTATAGKASYVLARVGFWSCRFDDAIAHARQAIPLLAKAEDRWWLGHAYCYLAGSHGLKGECASALAANAEARGIARITADPRLQSFADWTAGAVHVVQGDLDEAIASCRRGLAVAPDPINAAATSGILGWAYCERNAVDEATDLLRRAAEQFRRVGFRPFQAWFTGHLAEALRIGGQLDDAREVGREGVVLATEAGFPYAAGLSEHALGRVARAMGDLAGAERRLDAAAEIFASIDSRYERAHVDLTRAETATARGDPEQARGRMSEARSAFVALELPRQVARADRLAAELLG